MYNTYFGFREKPFKLVPNPEYLFLSKTHEIALAHLTYATDQGDGFVVIIGEVGTGKTTLCRNYLESLNDKIDSAYIFNPQLNAIELLAAICHEFGLATRQASAKGLLDDLNKFLIMQNASGRKVVLLIDEAQLLSIKNLELVRMLSNLETTKNKLLQIILVGQPELGKKLETYELRQLAQRISLNYHLAPLSQQDTEAYIQHRLGIAMQRQSKLFTSNACRLAYRYSKGIPRLINIVCDRALLVAFSQNKARITKSVMRAAVSELMTSSSAPKSPKRRPLIFGAGVCVLLLLLAGALFLMYRNGLFPFNPASKQSGEQQGQTSLALKAKTYKVPLGQVQRAAGQNPPPSGNANSSEAVANQNVGDPLPEAQRRPSVPSVDSNTPRDSLPGASADAAADMEKLIGVLDPVSSRKNTAAVLLSLWNQPRPSVDLIPPEVEDDDFFDIVARQYGLRRYMVRDNWELVKIIDLPAIVSLQSPMDNTVVYLSIVGWIDGRLQLADRMDGTIHEVAFESVKPYLDGPVHIFWKNLTGFDMIIGYGADERAVMMIKRLLRKVGYGQISQSPVFDAHTKKAVRRFQAEHNLKIDGLVGPLTKIMLLRDAGTVKMPQLSTHSRAES
ncbi:MAG: AAA family ATPase [Desulfobacteraceae bacterium]|jgi:general secretion pathway protein A